MSQAMPRGHATLQELLHDQKRSNSSLPTALHVLNCLCTDACHAALWSVHLHWQAQLSTHTLHGRKALRWGQGERQEGRRGSEVGMTG
jgi:hypothetical protein